MENIVVVDILVVELFLIKTERSGHVVVRSGKGGKRREVPLNSTARSVLADWIANKGDNEPLFPSQKGGHLSVRGVEYLVEKYAYDARLENVTPHILRHTFCKSLVDAGESLDKVRIMAGHKSLNTTVKYTGPTRQDLQRSVESISWQ